MNCCDKCFNDDFLSGQIVIGVSDKSLACEVCGASEVYMTDALTLVDYLAPVLDLYLESDNQNAKPIWIFLKEDWKLFENVSDENCEKLLCYMFPKENFNSKKFQASQDRAKKLLSWEDFKEELKHENRFFPEKRPRLNELESLFSHLIMKDKVELLYRARIKRDDEIDISKMGRPPEHKAKYGRANPSGISYLYTASNIETAIAEVRPQIGDEIYIATFKLNDSLKLLDLRNPREMVSPFSLNEDALLRFNIDLEYLCQLGNELSKPVHSSKAHLDYLASQYLCEFVKHLNYDGVVYKSSVGEGFNFALFNENKVEIQDNLLVKEISSITYVHKDF